jgi:hypothetical protein
MAFVRTDVLEEGITIISVTKMDELGTTLANIVPNSPILVNLVMEAILSTETSFLTRTIRRNIPEDGSLYVIYAIDKAKNNGSHNTTQCVV